MFAVSLGYVESLSLAWVSKNKVGEITRCIKSPATHPDILNSVVGTTCLTACTATHIHTDEKHL